MRRMGLGLITAALVFAFSSLLYARMGDEEWKTFQKEIMSKAGAKDPKLRALAAGKLGEADRKEACEILLRMMEYCEKVREPLLKEHGKLAEQVENIGAGPQIMAPGVPSVPKHDQMRPIATRMRELESLMSSEDDVRDACIEALSKAQDKDAIDWLCNTAIKSNIWSDRAGVAEVLGIVKHTGSGVALAAAFDREKDPRVKVPILESIALIGAKDGVSPMAKALGDNAWQVRSAAIAGLKKIGGKEAIEALIPPFEKENMMRLRNEYAAALLHLTGMDYGKDTTTWKKWWADNAGSWSGPAQKPPSAGHAGGAGGTAAFFGIPVDSDKVVFILDISGSMNELTKNEGEKTISSGAGGKESDDTLFGEHPKIDVAKYELKKCIKKLKKDVKFNIYFFNDAWTKWQDNLVAADAKWKEEAYNYIDKQSANAQTNVWDPLEDALKSAGMGLNDKHYASNLDTVFLLSDGSPYPPDLYVGPEDILKRVREMNSLKKVKIHCIGIGGGQNTMLLQGLANMTGGTYVKR